MRAIHEPNLDMIFSRYEHSIYSQEPDNNRGGLFVLAINELETAADRRDGNIRAGDLAPGLECLRQFITGNRNRHERLSLSMQLD